MMNSSDDVTVPGDEVMSSGNIYETMRFENGVVYVPATGSALPVSLYGSLLMAIQNLREDMLSDRDLRDNEDVIFMRLCVPAISGTPVPLFSDLAVRHIMSKAARDKCCVGLRRHTAHPHTFIGGDTLFRGFPARLCYHKFFSRLDMARNRQLVIYCVSLSLSEPQSAPQNIRSLFGSDGFTPAYLVHAFWHQPSTVASLASPTSEPSDLATPARSVVHAFPAMNHISNGSIRPHGGLRPPGPASASALLNTNNSTAKGNHPYSATPSESASDGSIGGSRVIPPPPSGPRPFPAVMSPPSAPVNSVEFAAAAFAAALARDSRALAIVSKALLPADGEGSSAVPACSPATIARLTALVDAVRHASHPCTTDNGPRRFRDSVMTPVSFAPFSPPVESKRPRFDSTDPSVVETASKPAVVLSTTNGSEDMPTRIYLHFLVGSTPFDFIRAAGEGPHPLRGRSLTLIKEFGPIALPGPGLNDIADSNVRREFSKEPIPFGAALAFLSLCLFRVSAHAGALQCQRESEEKLSSYKELPHTAEHFRDPLCLLSLVLCAHNIIDWGAGPSEGLAWLRAFDPTALTDSSVWSGREDIVAVGIGLRVICLGMTCQGVQLVNRLSECFDGLSTIAGRDTRTVLTSTPLYKDTPTAWWNHVVDETAVESLLLSALESPSRSISVIKSYFSSLIARLAMADTIVLRSHMIIAKSLVARAAVILHEDNHFSANATEILMAAASHCVCYWNHAKQNDNMECYNAAVRFIRSCSGMSFSLCSCTDVSCDWTASLSVFCSFALVQIAKAFIYCLSNAKTCPMSFVSFSETQSSVLISLAMPFIAEKREPVLWQCVNELKSLLFRSSTQPAPAHALRSNSNTMIVTKESTSYEVPAQRAPPLWPPQHQPITLSPCPSFNSCPNTHHPPMCPPQGLVGRPPDGSTSAEWTSLWNAGWYLSASDSSSDASSSDSEVVMETFM